MEARKPKVGEQVAYVDPRSRVIPALVTAVWGPQCVNVVFVSLDGDKSDTFGRQIERQTSCVHSSLQQAPGNYWRFSDEQGKATEQ